MSPNRTSGWMVLLLVAAPRLAAAELPGPPVLELKGHENAVFHVVYSPDGKLLATCGKDHTVRLWDAVTGKLLHTLKGHKSEVYSSAFSPDGRLLASASEDHTVKLWETVTGKEVRTFTGHSDDVYCVDFSPDGTLLASGSSDRTACIWNVATGNTLHQLGGHSGRVLSVAFSPDGSRLASACASAAGNTSDAAGEVRFWDVKVGQEIASLPDRNLSVVTVAFNPQGKRLAGSTMKHTVKVWELATRQEALELTGHTLEVYHVRFSPDGRRLASCSGKWSTDQGGELKIWDAATGKELLSFKPHTTPIWSIAFSPDGKRIASATGKWNGPGGGEVKVWDLSALPAPAPGHTPTADEMDALWTELAGKDVAKAHRAVWALSGAGAQAVAFLEKRIRPPSTNASYERLPRLIADLDDSDFDARRRAFAELEKLGKLAHPALRRALLTGSKEVQRQARLLLEIRGEALHLSAEEIQMLRAIEVLQMIGTDAVKPALRKLAIGPAEAPVPREARLALEWLERKRN